MLAVLMIALFQPHSSSLHKKIDLVLFSMLSLVFVTLSSREFHNHYVLLTYFLMQELTK